MTALAAGGININIDIHGRVHRGFNAPDIIPDLSDGGIPQEYCLASQGVYRNPRLGEAELKSVFLKPVLSEHQDKTAM